VSGEGTPPPDEPLGTPPPVPPRALPPRTPPPSYLPPPSPRTRPAMAPIEPLGPERSGPLPWVWALAAVGAAAVVALVLVLVLRSGSGGGPLVVGTDVSLAATSDRSGDCVTTVHLTATGSVSGSGTLVYRFERSDGQATGNTQLAVDGNSGFEVTEDWRFAGVHAGGGTMVFRIVSPTTREVRRDVTVTCP
jgi:hypothetical protein